MICLGDLCRFLPSFNLIIVCTFRMFTLVLDILCNCVSTIICTMRIICICSHLAITLYMGQWNLQIMGHIGTFQLSLVYREVVLISEVIIHTKCPIGAFLSVHYQKLSLSRSVLYQRFHCISIQYTSILLRCY